MPRKNKRKFFGGLKSSKSKSAKLEENALSSDAKQQSDIQQQNESDSEEQNNENQQQMHQEEEIAFEMRKSSVHTSSSSVTNDSAIGQLELSSLPEANDTKMGGTLSCASSPSMPSRTLRWCSEPNLNNNNNNAFINVKRFGGAGGSQKATITLKVIQFIGEIPKETRDINSAVVADSTAASIDAPKNQKKLNDIEENESMARDSEQNNQKNKFKSEKEILNEEKEEIDSVPKLDHYKEDEANEPQQQNKTRFDDNYRVESPKQISSHVIEEKQKTQVSKRHAMLIQEISESSSSEEVKQFLDNEACAIESINSPIMKIESLREYRVDSPESSDDCNKTAIDDNQPSSDENQTIIVQEIVESSSNESVKNEILSSMSKLPSQFTNEPSITIVSSSNTKIINIKELPSEIHNLNNNNNNSNDHNNNDKILTTHGTSLTTTQSTSTKVKLFECKSEKKLNKAEEAIIEALYGNSNLLQIPNTPLDVISEEGSDCSDIERQNSGTKLNNNNNNNNNSKNDSNKQKVILDYDEDEDDDVFLESTVPNDAKFYRHRILQTLQKQRIAEQPKLINTKIIETESNVPEGCKTWKTKQSDSELQAELVYLTSASSSATDLSERSSNTDTEEVEDVSEDTDTNSLLENISVPSLCNIEIHKDTEKENKKHEHVIDDVAHSNNSKNLPIQYQQLQSDYYQEINEQQQKLPDILEEDEEQQSRSLLEIIESQQQIEDVNKELHHLISLGNEENEYESRRMERGIKRSKSSENVCDKTINLIACDDKKQISDISEGHGKEDLNKVESKSGTPTPTQIRRKYSSDSSTSSSNSQCTIIRQIVPIDNVYALRDLCVQSINANNNECEGKITVQKKFNSLSRNAPNIPIINELEMHYECDNDDLQCRENVKSKDKVITILQVPPEMNSSICNNNQSNSSNTGDEKDRWFGMQSSQMPNLMVALSPLQKNYMMNAQDSNTSSTSADVLLDMHKKFVERRAYHEEEINRVLDEESSGKNSDTSRIVNILKSSPNECQLEDSNLSNSSNTYSNESVLKSNNICETNDGRLSDEILVDKTASYIEAHKILTKNHNDTMDSIRNLISRESAAIRDNNDEDLPKTKDEFQVKKYELENELRKLDYERKELEEELKNIQSLQHFKREEFLYNQKKLEDEKQAKNENQTTIESHHNQYSVESSNDNNTNANNLNNVNKYVNDDFNDFINSNEKLHKEIYNEWQDKVCERNERKLHKMLKITNIIDNNRDDSEQQPPLRLRERAASERIVPLNDEFLAKVKERQKRLSLPLDDNLDASTESLLNECDENDGLMRRKKKKLFQFENKENFPSHFREFIEYCEQEIVQSKNSVESGESLKKPLYLGLIGVALCICGFYIGKHFLTTNSKFSP